MKRIFGNDAAEVNGSLEPQLKKQRPVLGVMREVMGVQCMKSHLPKLEPFLRRVVQEEVGKALCRFVHSAPRLPNNRFQVSASRPYRLHFQNSLPQTLFTGSRIEAEGRMPVQIVIMDTKLNKIITSGPLSSAKIEILVLDGDFGSDDQLEWTEKEFGDGILREREGKRPLLTGELVVIMNNGVGYLGDVAFTDNSSWIRSRKFRLGARLLQSRCGEVDIQEAISGPFWVKDHRGELYRKHHPPSPNDEVWRLEKIGKDGAFHRRLADNRINTVQDFLRHLVMDPDGLRTLLGSGMSNKIWEATIEHAKECILDDKHYVYCNGQGVTLLFNSIYEVVGAMFGDSPYPLSDLTASQKVLVNKLKQLAYKNHEQIIEFNSGVETLPQSLPTSNAISAPQASCSELHTAHLNISHLDESAAQLTVVRQPLAPCSELLDTLQPRAYFTGQDLHTGQSLRPPQANSFNMRYLLDLQFGDIPSAGPPGPIIAGDPLAGYNPEIDMAGSSYPLPLWDYETFDAERSGSLVPHTTNLSRSQISPHKWVKLVAALKLMTASKRLAAKNDELVDSGNPVQASTIGGNSHLGWFSDEGQVDMPWMGKNSC